MATIFVDRGVIESQSVESVVAANPVDQFGGEVHVATGSRSVQEVRGELLQAARHKMRVVGDG